MDRLIIIDGYNLIHRTPQREAATDARCASRARKLAQPAHVDDGFERRRILVVVRRRGRTGQRERGRGRGTGSKCASRPPQNISGILIREIVEDQVERGITLTVVTGDIEVAQHARAMGAQV